MAYFSSMLCSSVVSGYVLFEIMGLLYEKKYPANRWIYKIGILTYVILSVLISGAKNNAFNIIGSMLIFFLLASVLYVYYDKNSFVNSAFRILYFAMIDMILTAVSSIFVRKSVCAVFENSKFCFLSGVSCAVLMICTFHFLIKSVKCCDIHQVSKSMCLFMLLLAAVELTVLGSVLLFASEVEHNMALLLICMGFVVVDGGVLFVLKVLSRNRVLEKQAELIEQQRIMNAKYYEGLQECYTETRKLLHDMERHVGVIESLEVQNGRLKDEYVMELMETLENIQQDFQCSDQILCAIFCEKIRICERENIALDINIQDVKFDFMDRIELTSLFSNLLDNAIEACRESRKTKKEISLRIHQFKDYIVIRMSNTLGTPPVVKNRKLQSTKEGHSGMGILILSSLASKYCGHLKYDYTEDDFETKMILSTNHTSL